jgi:hypothetical protein
MFDTQNDFYPITKSHTPILHCIASPRYPACRATRVACSNFLEYPYLSCLLSLLSFFAPYAALRVWPPSVSDAFYTGLNFVSTAFVVVYWVPTLYLTRPGNFQMYPSLVCLTMVGYKHLNLTVSNK